MELHCNLNLKLKLVVAPFWQFLEVTHMVDDYAKKHCISLEE